MAKKRKHVKPQGGGGALLNRKDNTRSDLKMIERAVRRQWGIEDRLFDVLPTEATKIALGARRTSRERLAAMRLLVSMNGQNQSDEHKETPDRHIHAHVTTDPIYLPVEQRRTIVLSLLGNAPESLDAPTEARVVETAEHPLGNGNALGANAQAIGGILPTSPVAKANGHVGNGAH